MLRGGPGVPPRLVTLRLSPSAGPDIQMLLQPLRGHNYGQHQKTCLFWKLLPQEWDRYHGMEEGKVVSATRVQHPGTVPFLLPELL